MREFDDNNNYGNMNSNKRCMKIWLSWSPNQIPSPHWLSINNPMNRTTWTKSIANSTNKSTTQGHFCNIIYAWNQNENFDWFELLILITISQVEITISSELSFRCDVGVVFRRLSVVLSAPFLLVNTFDVLAQVHPNLIVIVFLLVSAMKVKVETT